MAGPVKGEWDGKPIELNDAATETTLLKVLEALKKNGGGTGGGAGGAGNSAAEASKNIEEMGKNADLASESIDDMGEAASGFARGIAGALGNIKNATIGLAEEFLIGGDSLSDFSQHFATLANEIPVIGGLLGGALQTVTGLLDNQIDNYRELSNAGVVFGASLFDAQRAAAQTNLTLDQFSSVVTSNSAAMAAIGGTAGNGAKVFANISRIMKEDFGTQFQALGIQAAEQAEYTAGYLTTLARTGRLERMTAEQQAAGAANYIKQLDKLSKATGLQREAIEAEMQQVAIDERFQLIMSTLPDHIATEMSGMFAYVSGKISPEFSDALKDIVATGGAPMSELGESIMLMHPEIGEMAIAVREGRASQEEFEAAVVAAQEEIEGMSEAERRQAGTLAAMGDTTYRSTMMMQAAGNAADALTDAQQEQQDQIDKGSEGLLGFGARLTDLRNQIIGKLIDSGVFDKLETTFNQVVSYFTEGGGFTAITGALDKFGDWFSNLYAEMSEAEDPMTFIIDKVKSWWKDIDIKGMIWDAIFGGSSSSESSSSEGGAAGMDGPGSDDLSSSSSSGNADTGGFFDDLSEKLGTFGTILGAGGAVFLAVKGFQALLAGFGTGPVAVGAAVFTGMLIGTGAAILAAGKGIDLAGDGIEKVAAGVERMAAVEGAANFADIAESLGKLGPALISLTAGGVLDSITSFFGADSPFDKLIEGINGFGSIESTAVSNMSQAGTAISTFADLTDDLDGSKIEQYADSIKELATAMEKLNEALAETNEGGMFSDGSGVSASSLLSSGQLSLGGGGSGSGSSDQLERLNSTMQQILTAINDTSRREVQAINSMSNSVY